MVSMMILSARLDIDDQMIRFIPLTGLAVCLDAVRVVRHVQ